MQAAGQSAHLAFAILWCGSSSFLRNMANSSGPLDRVSLARSPARPHSRESRMTYSMVARCPRTGQLGIGVASYSMAIGLYCDGAVRANTGVTLTQGFPNPRNNYLAINLLALGRTAGQALTELIGNDRDSEYRQIAMVDRDNDAVAHSGANLRKWAGHRIGKPCGACG